MKNNFAVMVGQHHWVKVAECPAQVQLLLLEDGHGDDESREDVIEQGEDVRVGVGVGGWYCMVVNVTSDDKSIDAFRACRFDELVEDIGRIIQQRDALEMAAKVPVGSM